jgi:nitrous oxidase accessory protein NosD
MTPALRFTVPIATLLLAALPSGGLAETIKVPPGIGTLQAAIDAAAPGDVLQLEPEDYFGAVPVKYFGAVVVNKAVRVQGPGRIVADCTDPIALDITADGVQLSQLNVARFAVSGIRIAGRSRVT